MSTSTSAPARAHGNVRSCFVVFHEASNGDLVDITHWCDDCAFFSPYYDQEQAQYWPAFFAYAEEDVFCTRCNEVIHRAHR